MSESTAEPIAEALVDVNQRDLIRVLHVDDDSSLLKITKQCLEMEAPIRVDTVTSVDEALAKLRKDTYDVIVSDYLMPGKDGLALLKELRQNGNTTPFVMFTGKGREEVAIKALNFGANQYINKIGETETVYAELTHSITELAKAKRIEEKQRQSEEKFRDLFEKANDGLVFFDMAGTILDINQKAAEIAGKSKEEIVGKSFLDLGLIGSKHVNALADRLQDRKNGKPLDRVEVEIEKKNGQKRTIEISSTPIQAHSYQIGFLAIARDITERKKTEKALLESEQKFRNLFEKAHDGLVLIGMDGRIIDMNQKAAELAGQRKEEIVGKSFLKLGLVDWKNIPQLLGLLKKVFKKQPAGNFKIAIRSKTGELRHLEVNTSNVEQDGATIGALAIVRDVTERVRAEEARCESEERLKAVFTSSPDAITVFDLHGNVVDLNTAAMKLQGFSSKEEIVGKSSFDFVALEDRKRAVEAFQGVLKKGHAKDLEFTLLDKNGRGFPILLSAAVVLDSRRKPSAVVATFKDITEMKAIAEQRLETQATIQESQQEFEALFMGNPEAAVHVGPDFCILEANSRFEKLFGYKLDEIRGRNINDVVVPEDKIDEAQMLDYKAKQDNHVSQDTVRKKKDGSLFPVFVSAAPITLAGRFLGYVAVYKDISELKETENKLENMNEKLRVTGGLTRHDVRNKLSAITGNVYLLKKQLADNRDIKDKLGEIENAVNQVTRIFDFAKAYEMLGAEELSFIDVAKTLDEAVSLFVGLTDVKVVNECLGMAVLADSLLRQLLYNLIDNSLKHGKKVSKIRVYYEKGQGQLKLFYEDDGVGIPATEKPQLFKECYSTEGGTGYGLYLIKKIVEVYGWTIQETGNPGRGAQFTVTIPQANKHGKRNYQIA